MLKADNRKEDLSLDEICHLLSLLLCYLKADNGKEDLSLDEFTVGHF